MTNDTSPFRRPTPGESEASAAAPGDLARFAPPQAPGEDYWRHVRSAFDLKPGWTFFNHGTQGPTPLNVTAVYHAAIDELSHDPASNPRDRIQSVRNRLARFVAVDPAEIALTRSTTEGMNIFAHGLDWKPGDEVIIGTHEHFGGVQPYQTLRDRFGIRIIEIDSPVWPATNDQIVAAYEAALTSATRLIVVSHVNYVTGLRAPIRELADLAHRNGVLISVDGAQSLGVLPLDLGNSNVDHYAGSGQKWFLAGTGTGFSYIKREVQDRVWPTSGYHDLNAAQDNPWAGQRYERVGQKNVPSLLAIGAAVDLHNTIGPETIAGRVADLATRLRSGLKSIPGVRLWTGDDPAFTAGLTTFSANCIASADLVQTLRSDFQIVIRPIQHAEVDAVRVSTHFFNSPEEVDRLVSVVDSLTAR